MKWRQNWDATAPTPARGKATLSVKTALAAQQRTITFTGLCVSCRTFDNSFTRVTVMLEHDIAIPLGDTETRHHAAGSELEVSMRGAPPPAAKLPQPMDRIQIVECCATPNTKTPGAFYNNMRSVELITSCWDSDDQYLARQSLDGNNKFVVVSRLVETPTDKNKPVDGLLSRLVWPEGATMVTREKGEILFLHFRLQHASWTAQNVVTDDKEPPLMRIFSLKLWAQQCEQMIPGGGGDMSIEAWKELMAHGINPVPFVALCSVATEADKWSNGDQALKLHEFRADFAQYITGPTCPTISRALVQRLVPRAAAPKKKVDGIVNVSVTGLYSGVSGAFPTFRVMTSTPDQLTNEQAIVDAMDNGTLGAIQVFAVPSKGNDDNDEKAATAEPPTKKKSRVRTVCCNQNPL